MSGQYSAMDMFEQTLSIDLDASDLPSSEKPDSGFNSIPDAIAALKAGEAIVVVDDEDRENEGDIICAAEFATPSMINFMATHARGLICLAMTGDRLDQLRLPLMVSSNTDPHQTAFAISIDAASQKVGTGISAYVRSRTIQVAIASETQPQDIRRPGHVFPLRAQAGGVLKRRGHTEAAVDLTRLAGLFPAGVICEIQNPNGSMARLPELFHYARSHQLRIISIADLVSYRLRFDLFVVREAIAELPSQFGQFQIYGYRNLLDASEATAIVKGDPNQFAAQPTLVRIHSECLTGDAFGSLRCDCGQQLQTALQMIEAAGQGVIVHLRRFQPDLRTYEVGAQILKDLHLRNIRLLTNNPQEVIELNGWDFNIVAVPLGNSCQLLQYSRSNDDTEIGISLE